MTAPIRWLSDDEWEGLKRLKARDPLFTIPEPICLRLRHLGLARQEYGWITISPLGEQICSQAAEIQSGHHGHHDHH